MAVIQEKRCKTCDKKTPHRTIWLEKEHISAKFECKECGSIHKYGLINIWKLHGRKQTVKVTREDIIDGTVESI